MGVGKQREDFLKPEKGIQRGWFKLMGGTEIKQSTRIGGN